MSTRSQHEHRAPPPRAYPEYAHLQRYWDKMHDIYATKILPGDCYVTGQDEAVVTVLGSCVSACVRDPGLGIGGMNHFMLPEGGPAHNASPVMLTAAARYGNFAMEQLINGVLSHGGRRERLEVKVFGGGRVLRAMTDIGARNIAFVHAYLAMEGLTPIAHDLGGEYPRKVYYFPASGRVRVKKLVQLHNRTLLERESDYRRRIAEEPVDGGAELF